MADDGRIHLRSCPSEGGDASSITGDVSLPEDCQKIVKTAVERYGKLDILHNNVGIDSAGRMIEKEIEEWDRVMNVNLRSMMLMCRVVPAPSFSVKLRVCID